MKKIYLTLFFCALIAGIFASTDVSAAVSVGGWQPSQADVATIQNGQNIVFDYGVQAVTAKNGRYMIALYDDTTNALITTLIPWTNTVGNGAQGFFTLTPTHYTRPGRYVVIIHAIDDFNPDQFRLVLTVSAPAVPLTAACSISSTAGVTPFSTTFTGSAAGGSGTYTYTWNFNDGTANGGGITTTHTYAVAGTYNPVLTVSDGLTTVNAACPSITARLPNTLTIINLSCFDVVVRGQNQACAVHVVDEYNNPAPGVDVNIYYTSGTLFGSCVTDSVSGGCTVYRGMNAEGTFTVYSTATKAGYINDVDRQPQFTFRVFSPRYEIRDLNIYGDAAFTQQKSTFYRGENLYARFRIYDTSSNQYIRNDLVNEAVLVSAPGGIADLERTGFNGEWHYYRLTPIPLTHDFLGGSNVFAFKFNFTDNSGGQAQVPLTILNNNPVAYALPTLTLRVGETRTVALCNYATDREDQNALRWTFQSVSAAYTVQLMNGVNAGCGELRVTGVSSGSGRISLRVFDLDNAYADTSVLVGVETTIIVNGTVTANIGGPYTGYVGEPLTIDASLSTGPIVRYVWNFGDGITQETFTPTTIHTYAQTGRYPVSLTVYDTVGASHTATTSATILDRAAMSNVTEKEDRDYGLTLNRIIMTGTYSEFVKRNDDLQVTVEVENDGDRVDDARVMIMIPELGIVQKSGAFDLSRGEEETVTMNVELYDAPSGVYYVKIIAGNSVIKAAKYRDIIVR